MDSAIMCALISGVVTLLVSIGTWHVTAKKDHNENKQLVFNKVEELKDDITAVNANVQQQIALQTQELAHLRIQVEKHNGVLERMFKLEQVVEDMRQLRG